MTAEHRTTTRAVAPFGTWPSPIAPELLTRAVPDVGEVAVVGGDVWWTETRPANGGRTTLVRRRRGAERPDDVLSPGYSVRSTVYEYGGGAWCIAEDGVHFVNERDQLLYRLSLDGNVVRVTTSVEAAPRRYADLGSGPGRRSLVAVREMPDDREPRHEIVAVDVDGSAPDAVLVSGPDFVWSPSVSPDGSWLAWVQWSHPFMPWERAELWVARVRGGRALVDPVRLAGGVGASVFQPEWCGSGVLLFLCEESGFWNVHAAWPTVGGWRRERRVAIEAEVGIYAPSGVMGVRRYCLLDDETIVFAYVHDGADRLAMLPHGTGEIVDLPNRFSQISQVRGDRNGVVVAGSSFTSGLEIVRIELAGCAETVLREPPDFGLGLEDISVPEARHLPARDGATIHAFYYRPANRTYVGPPGERMPLLVMSHGGPTDAASSALNVVVQYWTSRGFAVLDVNYRGSTGFGREYREALRRRWGELDVTDCLDATVAILSEGEVDPSCIGIRGGSAGGFTALCALAASDLFAAGVSRFGVSDLTALARDTHKFESHLLDGLVGPYPEAGDLYANRSPVYHAVEIATPVFLVQGLDDTIVPPSQAETMIEAFERVGTRYAYLPLPGEGHGFRKGESIRLALESELRFYSMVFGFTPGEQLPDLSLEGTARN